MLNPAIASQIYGASVIQPTATMPCPLPSGDIQLQPQQQRQYQAEYSIFVGDLAPETSNSDLVAVFRNPVLGLRDDREPKFIRPFLSCKSAKIMLDPVTGVSRGYGFVRFIEEADQQRALIEMHGLYCLSRPMRISPATAKIKPLAFLSPTQPGPSLQVGPRQPAHITHPLSPSSLAGHVKTPSLDTADPHQPQRLSPPLTRELGDLPVSATSSISPADSNSTNISSAASSTAHLLTEESRKHHAQVRSILEKLIGPNGEQLATTDPYNTTVFVGGLSPMINEDTLRTFFAPFGELHYVKVPVGKNCGFVQFVKKVDAEKAIETLQGFPIAGSHIRLSWGRSQYKAAQAAAQAAQAAIMRQYEVSSTQTPGAPGSSIAPGSHANTHPIHKLTPSQASNAPVVTPTQAPPQSQRRPSTAQTLLSGIDIDSLTSEQAIQLLRKLSVSGCTNISATEDDQQDPRQMDLSRHGYCSLEHQHPSFAPIPNSSHCLQYSPGAGLYAEEQLRAAHLSSKEDTIGPNFHHMGHLQSQSRLGIFDYPLSNLSPQDRRPSVPEGSPFSPFSPGLNYSSTGPSNDDLIHGSLPRRRSLVSPGIGDANNSRNHGSNASLSGRSSYSSSPTPSDSSVGVSHTLETVNGPSQGTARPIISYPSGMAHGSGVRRPSIDGARLCSAQQKSEPFDLIHDINGTLTSLGLDFSPNAPVVGSPTNGSFVSARPLTQYGVGSNIWGMTVG